METSKGRGQRSVVSGQHRTTRFLLSALVIASVLFLTAISQCAIIHVKPTGADANDGFSWDLAKKSVAAGLIAAAADDEVWVAAGAYLERITLKLGVGLYGGFAGTETSRDQRNWRVNVTVLNGTAGGTVVTAPAGATATTRIDGFTIRSGKASYGGGIYCSTSSPTIANNTIIGSGDADGVGIYCTATPTTSASPTIINNIITGNNGSYGGGIMCLTNSSPLIANNIITANRAYVGGGIYCCSPATIVNNTITANVAGHGGGIAFVTSSATVVNNIVAFNSSGLEAIVGGSPPVLTRNCVYNPDGQNYIGLTPVSDIQMDPLLVAVEYGQVHIQPLSPCIDVGNADAVQPGWVDMDGQARIQNDYPDIGADESDGTQWTFTPAVVRVSPSGDDTNDGSSWFVGGPMRTVQAAADAASARGGEVWVAAGTYAERIQMLPYVSLYGGFRGTELYREQRDWRAYPTVLDGGAVDTVVEIRAGLGTIEGALDGFTIRNGKRGGSGNGGGIVCAGSSPTIANNLITANRGDSGGGVYSSGSPTIINNVITGNTGLMGGGIYTAGGSALIANNTISDNNGLVYGGGIYCSGGAPTLANNLIAFNTSFNGSGIYNDRGTLTLSYNCLYNPGGSNYSGVTPGATDIQVDPLLVDRAAGDYHLAAGSPCIDAGDRNVVQSSWRDIDVQARVIGPQVDIGADEVAPPDTFGTTLFKGWNLISLPARPVDPDPAVVFAGLPINDQLVRWDPTTLSYIGYWDVNPSEFGPLKVGEGYWLMLDQHMPVSYQGYPDSAPKSISLPLPGWHLIGQPRNGITDVNMCSLTGTNAPPVCSVMPIYGWYPAELRYWEVGCDGEPINDSNLLLPWRGYWLNTPMANLTLVVPEP